MYYVESCTKSTIIIPPQLLKLFKYYENDIIEKNSNFQINEASEEYIITNNILNTKKSEKTFNETLFAYIDKSNLSDVAIYKKAYIDRRLFSKIKSNNEYHPSFGTVVLLALALELTTKEFEDLLKSASYSLPQNSYANITLKYCFDNQIHNINFVNNLMYTILNKQIKDL